MLTLLTMPVGVPVGVGVGVAVPVRVGVGVVDGVVEHAARALTNTPTIAKSRRQYAHWNDIRFIIYLLNFL